MEHVGVFIWRCVTASKCASEKAKENGERMAKILSELSQNIFLFKGKFFTLQKQTTDALKMTNSKADKWKNGHAWKQFAAKGKTGRYAAPFVDIQPTFSYTPVHILHRKKTRPKKLLHCQLYCDQNSLRR